MLAGILAEYYFGKRRSRRIHSCIISPPPYSNRHVQFTHYITGRSRDDIILITIKYMHDYNESMSSAASDIVQQLLARVSFSTLVSRPRPAGAAEHEQPAGGDGCEGGLHAAHQPRAA